MTIGFNDSSDKVVTQHSGPNGCVWIIAGALSALALVAIAISIYGFFFANASDNTNNGADPNFSTPSAVTATETATVTSTMSAAEATDSDEDLNATEAVGDDRCHPEAVGLEAIVNDEMTVSNIYVDFCDGKWAQWSVGNPASSTTVVKWNGEKWEQFMQFFADTYPSEACDNIKRAKDDGAPVEVTEQHAVSWGCE